MVAWLHGYMVIETGFHLFARVFRTLVLVVTCSCGTEQSIVLGGQRFHIVSAIGTNRKAT